jgi:hypothetical protein
MPLILPPAAASTRTLAFLFDINLRVHGFQYNYLGIVDASALQLVQDFLPSFHVMIQRMPVLFVCKLGFTQLAQNRRVGVLHVQIDRELSSKYGSHSPSTTIAVDTSCVFYLPIYGH